MLSVDRSRLFSHARFADDGFDECDPDRPRYCRILYVAICYFRVPGSNSAPTRLNCSLWDIIRRSRPVCRWYSLKKFVAAVSFVTLFPPVWSAKADDERAAPPKSLGSPEKPRKADNVSTSPAPRRPVTCPSPSLSTNGSVRTAKTWYCRRCAACWCRNVR